jgi:hypothetical protein
MNEPSSLEEVEGVSYGMQGIIPECQPDSLQKVAEAVKLIMERVDEEAGGFFGHVKAILSSSSESASVNGVDPILGVKLTGDVTVGKMCEVKVMAVVLDLPLQTLRGIVEEEMARVEGFRPDASRTSKIVEVK